MDIHPPREPTLTLRYMDAIRPREPDRVTIQIARTPEMMDIVYRLRHDSYVSQGFLEPRPSGMFADEWDEMKNTFSLLCFYDGAPAMSVRISDSTPMVPNTPRSTTVAMDGWHSEIMNLARTFQEGARPTVLLEMSRLTRHPDFPESDSDPIFGIFRAGSYCVVKTDADILLSTVRRHHMPFYRRFGYQKITDPRPYPKIAFEVGLMACFRQSYDAVQRSVPIFQSLEKHDSVYERLFAGERVRIFDEMPPRLGRR